MSREGGFQGVQPSFASEERRSPSKVAAEKGKRTKRLGCPESCPEPLHGLYSSGLLSIHSTENKRGGWTKARWTLPAVVVDTQFVTGPQGGNNNGTWPSCGIQHKGGRRPLAGKLPLPRGQGRTDPKVDLKVPGEGAELCSGGQSSALGPDGVGGHQAREDPGPGDGPPRWGGWGGGGAELARCVIALAFCSPPAQHLSWGSWRGL